MSRGWWAVVSHKDSPGVCFGRGRGRGRGGRGWGRRWGLSLSIGHQRWPRRHLVDWKETRLYFFQEYYVWKLNGFVCVCVFRSYVLLIFFRFERDRFFDFHILRCRWYNDVSLYWKCINFIVSLTGNWDFIFHLYIILSSFAGNCFSAIFPGKSF